jgi:hypothetical protein
LPGAHAREDVVDTTHLHTTKRRKTMDQLISQITQKTGISDQQARDTVQIVVGFIKEKLPSGMGSQLDALMAGQTPNLGNINMGDAQNVANDVGSMFNK